MARPSKTEKALKTGKTPKAVRATNTITDKKKRRTKRKESFGIYIYKVSSALLMQCNAINT